MNPYPSPARDRVLVTRWTGHARTNGSGLASQSRSGSQRHASLPTPLARRSALCPGCRAHACGFPDPGQPTTTVSFRVRSRCGRCPGRSALAMKITRQKHAKKYMSFYKYNFGFREPFQVLLDGTFCQAALRNKIQIRDQLPGYLAGATQLCTTRCVLKELESLGKELYGAKLIAQRFQVRNCSHFKDPVSGSACLLSMIEEGNPHHYFIATQDQDLATKVKKKAGVPLLFIIQNTMVLDKPSPKSLAFVQAMQANQLVPEHQKQSIEHLKEEQGLVKESENRRKRKRAGGPNPLSCLKKKKTVQETQQPSAAKKKRKRKRNRAKSEAKTVSVQLSVKA